MTALEASPELVREFVDYVVEALEVMLYSQEGRDQARKEGRWLKYDPNTMQLFVVDYPDNLAAVAEFIDSLPPNPKETEIQDCLPSEPARGRLERPDGGVPWPGSDRGDFQRLQRK